MHDTQTQITLGQRYADTVTSFEGVATAHCEYLNGTNMVRVENAENDRWIETERLQDA